MKVVHVVAGELTGGAARGAYWLHRALLDLGVDSKILTDSSCTFQDETVFSISTTGPGRFAKLIRRRADVLPSFAYARRKKAIFSTGLLGLDLSRVELCKEADIVHLHWINGGFINMKGVGKLGSPIVWTLRDMWPMTGGCHYSLDCHGFTSSCGYCPQLGSRSESDLSSFVLQRKKKHIPKDVFVVGISEWLTEEAKKSSTFSGFDARTIPNGIDMEQFFPCDKALAREALGLTTRKKLILVGAQHLGDFYKGFDKLLEAVEYLDSEKYMICFFGRADPKSTSTLRLEQRNLGFLGDASNLRLAYSAADVFVAPSLMDAFGKTIVESMACGTPVVCFDATGPKDIVEHKITGYKATAFEAADLAKGVEWLVDHPHQEGLAVAARERALRLFDTLPIANKYIELYKEMLEQRRVRQ